LKKTLFTLLLIFFVFSLTFGVGLGLTLYFKQNPIFIALVQRLVILVSMGVISGFACRLILWRRHNFWRILLVIVTIPLTLYVLDKMEANPYPVIFFRENWNNPIWGDFLQVSIGWITSIFFLVIGAKHKFKENITTLRPQTSGGVKKIITTKRSKSKSLVIRKVVSKTKSKPAIIRRSAKVRSRKNPLSIGYPSKTKRTGHKDVKLMGETEHRCTYCLELVKKNDPRGVVICTECKTWHHKDCWEITGTCQVAHRHDL